MNEKVDFSLIQRRQFHPGSYVSLCVCFSLFYPHKFYLLRYYILRKCFIIYILTHMRGCSLKSTAFNPSRQLNWKENFSMASHWLLNRVYKYKTIFYKYFFFLILCAFIPLSIFFSLNSIVLFHVIFNLFILYLTFFISVFFFFLTEQKHSFHPLMIIKIKKNIQWSYLYLIELIQITKYYLLNNTLYYEYFHPLFSSFLCHFSIKLDCIYQSNFIYFDFFPLEIFIISFYTFFFFPLETLYASHFPVSLKKNHSFHPPHNIQTKTTKIK